MVSALFFFRLGDGFFGSAAAAGRRGCCLVVAAMVVGGVVGEKAAARSGEFSVQTWGLESGLADPSVVALAQTGDGYLWAAGPRGLSRFDGVRFQTFGADAHRLLGEATALAGGDGDRLWIGTRRGDILSWSRDQLATVVPHAAGPQASIRSLAQDAQGSLWVATDQSVGIIRNGVFRLLSDGWNGRYGQRFKITATGAAGVCIESDRGFWEPAGEGEKLRAVREFSPGAARQSLASTASGGHWAAEASKLWHWATATTDAPRLVAEGVLWCGSHFVTASPDHDGGLWIASGCEGLVHFSASGDRTVVNVQDGLGSVRTLALLTDREGLIWAGTEGGGLSRLKPAVFRHWGGRQGLSKVSVLHAGGDNSLFVGTHGNGVWRLQGESLGLICEPLDPQPVDFTALVLTSNGGLFGGTRRSGLLNLGPQSANPVLGVPQPELPIHAVLARPDFSLWLGRQSGDPLLHCTSRGARAVALDPKPSDVRALLPARDGGLWVGTETHGLFRVFNEEVTHLGVPAGIPAAAVRALVETPEALWVGTAGSGLWRWKNGRWQACTARDGLPDDSIVGLQRDAHGALWFSTPRFFFRMEEESLAAWLDRTGPFPHPAVFGRADEMAGLFGYGDTMGCSAATPDGRLWFATSGGLVEVQPDRFRAPLARPKVVIEALEIDGSRVLPELAGASVVNSLAVQYTGLFLTDPDSLTFETRLVPLESDWSPRGGLRSAVYTGLAPGKYHFEVRATDRHGRFSENAAVAAFTVPPPFWARPWLLAAATLCLLAAAVGLTRARMSARLRRERERSGIERAVTEERSRIARDMHDEVSGGLMELALLGDHLARETARPEEISQVSARSRELMNAVNETVWLLNPDHDSVEGLASFLCRSALRWTRHSPLVCRFDVASSFDDAPLAAATRRHLFLCCKEAVHNAIKHSGASELMIRMWQTDDLIEITLSDNGRGFPGVSAGGLASSGGHGLSNIRQRLHSINGEASFDNRPGGGATVHLRFRRGRTSFQRQHP